MSSQTDEPTPSNTYKLWCVDCSFETTAEGDVFDALEVCDTHQGAHEDHASKHFVEFEIVG